VLLLGTYSGVVVDVADPLKLGRVRARVPHVYGPSDGAYGTVPDKDIPWALPAGIPSGKDATSGGMQWLPQIRDRVWVRFLDGEPEKPVYEWAMQDIESQSQYPLNEYETDGRPKAITKITRYGHVLELNSTSAILTSANGNSLLLDDGLDGGYANFNSDFYTLVGRLNYVNAETIDLVANDTFRLEASTSAAVTTTDFIVNANDTLALRAGASFTLLVESSSGTATIVSEDGSMLITAASGAAVYLGEKGTRVLAADGTTIQLGSGSIDLMTPTGESVTLGGGTMQVAASSVVVNSGAIGLGNAATFSVALAEKIVALFNTHIHVSPSSGGPTSIPVIPMLAEQIASLTTRSL